MTELGEVNRKLDHVCKKMNSIDATLRGEASNALAGNPLAGNPLLIPCYRAKKFIEELNREDKPRGQVTS